jgi:DNA-binding CsgD family transcriptional regulator
MDSLMSTNNQMNALNKPTLLDPLTERELDVLRLMADGLTNRKIADKLVIELETVRWYTKQIYSKLGVHSRTQASLRARDLGLFKPEEAKSVQRSGVSPQHNLPLYTTSFIGREQELNDLTVLLDDPNVRLITIAGPGGMGKTRLCVEAARAQASHFADGVFFIPLAPLNSVAEIAPAIAKGVNLRLKTDGDPREQVLGYLGDKQVLLVLDNFEHFLIPSFSPPSGGENGGASEKGTELVTDIIEAAPAVKILVTSRSSLNVGAEWVRYLDGISFPTSSDVEKIETYGAVKLFYDRVRRVRGDFSLVDHRDCVLEICRLVYGMPLAIELATAWLKALSCQNMAREIRHNIDILTTKQRDIDERHRSIRAVFDYSWRLLTDEEQRVFRRLSVFRGEFGRVAAEQVAGASLQILSELIENPFSIKIRPGYMKFTIYYAATPKNSLTVIWPPEPYRGEAVCSWPGLP